MKNKMLLTASIMACVLLNTATQSSIAAASDIKEEVITGSRAADLILTLDEIAKQGCV